MFYKRRLLPIAGPCAAKCQGTESCYMEHNCTHYEHCYAWNGAVCHCTLMICSFGTFWNSKINNCDMVAQVNCKSGKEKSHLDIHVLMVSHRFRICSYCEGYYLMTIFSMSWNANVEGKFKDTVYRGKVQRHSLLCTVFYSKKIHIIKIIFSGMNR